MEFRFLLPWLAIVFRGGEFTARDVSKCMLILSTKAASNELARLYRMGFLKRRRKKRVCTTRSGVRCHRGYEYAYSLSRQGLSYIFWMGRQDNVGKKSERIASEIVDALRKHSSPARRLASSHLLHEGFKKSNRRFPMLKRLTEMRLTQMLDELDKDERMNKRLQRLEKLAEDVQKEVTLMRERHAREIQEKERMIQMRDKVIQLQEETISELRKELTQMRIELLKLERSIAEKKTEESRR